MNSIIDRFRLDRKKALVTGGAKGIGAAIAVALAESGADVAIVDIDEKAAMELAEDLAQRTKKNCVAIKADVSDPDDIDRMMKTFVDKVGSIDVAVCNAGIVKNVPSVKMSLKSWNKIINVNLTGTFLTAQSVGKQMLKQKSIGGGSIIMTASVNGYVASITKLQCAYDASKAAIMQLARSLAVEWAEENIRVNSISPGYIKTNIFGDVTDNMLMNFVNKTPLGRIGTPEDIQAAVVFLASDASKFITGSDFIIDGGFTAV
jgi:NAD(P)-dependent dehydrogenase (short-subunit alcohol dehydrogenase family)